LQAFILLGFERNSFITGGKMFDISIVKMEILSDIYKISSLYWT